MLKKLILILTILTTSLFSFQVDMWQENNNAILNFNSDYDNVGGAEGNNWVAIYKAGDSNDWDNVITWAWAKDLAHNEAGNYDERILPLVTDDGSYEVRFFLNNSYDVFATYSYSNGGGNNASIGIADKNDNIITFNSTAADKAWIGIYNKGDANDWDYVKAWGWVTDASTIINISNLDSGTYEARLFYNNSYNVETTVEFTKDGGGNNQANLEIQSQTNSSVTFNSSSADKAWIGIYYLGHSNDWDNVQAWGWVDGSTTTIDVSNLPLSRYEARLFYNNSFDEVSSIAFTPQVDNPYRVINDVYPNITDYTIKSLKESPDGKYQMVLLRKHGVQFKSLIDDGYKSFYDWEKSGLPEDMHSGLYIYKVGEANNLKLIEKTPQYWVPETYGVSSFEFIDNGKQLVVNHSKFTQGISGWHEYIDTIDTESLEVVDSKVIVHY